MTGERVGRFGANIRIGIANERDQGDGELGAAKTADQCGGVAPFLPGAGEQPGDTTCQGLVVEGTDGGSEEEGGAAEGQPKHTVGLGGLR